MEASTKQIIAHTSGTLHAGGGKSLSSEWQQSEQYSLCVMKNSKGHYVFHSKLTSSKKNEQQYTLLFGKVLNHIDLREL